MRFLFACLCCLPLNLAAAWNASLSPWSAPDKGFDDWAAPVPLRMSEPWERFAKRYPPQPENLWLPALIGSDLLLGWQNTISGHDGSHCPHYPSCSRYSRIAVETYGLALGVIMTAERLSRCHEHSGEEGQYELRKVNGELMIWDPPQLDTWMATR